MENTSIFISVGSLIISSLAYYRQTERVQRKLIKKEALQSVAARAIVVWDQMQSILFCMKNKIAPDDYLFPSYQLNIQRLEEATDHAISVGLFDELIGSKDSAITYYSAFIQTLVLLKTKTLDAKKRDIAEWAPEHFLMGMVRTLNQCIERGAISKEHSAQLQNVKTMKEEAWNYMHKQKS